MRTGRFVNRVYRKLSHLEQWVFDRYLGVSTAGTVVTAVSTSDGSENWPYSGAPWLALTRVLRDVLPDTGSGSFVDLGSGKGRALLIAGRLPFRRVTGVEIDPGLSEAARENIARGRRGRRADVVESVTASVTDWRVPDGTSVVFLYNPFFGDTFRRAMENVFDSYDRDPRELHILYAFPWEHEWLLSTGRVVVERVRPESWPPRARWWRGEHVIVLYHVTGRDEPAGPCAARTQEISAAERRARDRWDSAAEHDFLAAL